MDAYGSANCDFPTYVCGITTEGASDMIVPGFVLVLTNVAFWYIVHVVGGVNTPVHTDGTYGTMFPPFPATHVFPTESDTNMMVVDEFPFRLRRKVFAPVPFPKLQMASALWVSTFGAVNATYAITVAPVAKRVNVCGPASRYPPFAVPFPTNDTYVFPTIGADPVPADDATYAPVETFAAPTKPHPIPRTFPRVVVETVTFRICWSAVCPPDAPYILRVLGYVAPVQIPSASGSTTTLAMYIWAVLAALDTWVVHTEAPSNVHVYVHHEFPGSADADLANDTDAPLDTLAFW